MQKITNNKEYSQHQKKVLLNKKNNLKMQFINLRL